MLNKMKRFTTLLCVFYLDLCFITNLWMPNRDTMIQLLVMWYFSGYSPINQYQYYPSTNDLVILPLYRKHNITYPEDPGPILLLTFHILLTILGETPALLTDSRADMLKLSEEVHTFAFDILFGQLKGYLLNLSNMEVGSDVDKKTCL